MIIIQISRTIPSAIIRPSSRKFITKRTCHGHCMLVSSVWQVCRYSSFNIIFYSSYFVPSGKTASFAWQEYSAAKKVHLNPPGIRIVLILNVIQGDVVFVTTGAGKACSPSHFLLDISPPLKNQGLLGRKSSNPNAFESFPHAAAMADLSSSLPNSRA